MTAYYVRVRYEGVIEAVYEADDEDEAADLACEALPLREVEVTEVYVSKEAVGG